MMVAYLGDGGLWHAGEGLTDRRRAAVCYEGNAICKASNIERAVPPGLRPRWTQAQRRENQGTVVSGGSTLESLNVTESSTLTLLLPRPALRQLVKRPPSRSSVLLRVLAESSWSPYLVAPARRGSEARKFGTQSRSVGGARAAPGRGVRRGH